MIYLSDHKDDVIDCEFCGELCGFGVDKKYNCLYECCEDCIDDVQKSIEDRKYDEKMDSTYSIN